MYYFTNRYINSSTLKLTENFLQFLPTNGITGKGIANLILLNLQQFGIHIYAGKDITGEVKFGLLY